MRAILCLVVLCSSLKAAEPMEKLLEARVFDDKMEHKLPYRLLKPKDYDPKKSYPLVVFLHGAGERGSDNANQMKHGVPQFASEANRTAYPCFLIAPQCPTGKQWVGVDWSAAAHSMPKDPASSAALTLGLIAELQKEFPIDSKRIYLTGLSMGGYGTWDLIARRPELFAAAVPVCGGGDEKTAATIAKLPIWAFHGDKDGAVPVARSRNMIAAIEKAGGAAKYTEYAGVGHDSWNKAYSDAKMFEWLFSQKRE